MKECAPILGICMDPRVRYGNSNLEQKAIMRGPLTDRRIEQYERTGYFDADRIEARKQYRFERARQRKRSGNFRTTQDGRLIYSPV